MKKILAMLTILTMMTFAAAALACHPGHPDYPACAAGSVSKTWTDVYNPNPDVYFHGEIGHWYKGKWIVDQAAFNTYSFTFNITDSGFVAGEDWINSYSIVFDFDDDNDGCFGDYEQAKVTVDNVQYKTTTDWWWLTINDLNMSFKGTTSLNADGTLLTTITRLDGDFYFDSATLTAVGCDFTPPPPPPPPQVPEPASLLLFGLGLLGVAGFRKRMKK